MYLQDNISSEFDHFSANYTNDMLRFVPHYKELMLALVNYLPRERDWAPKRILDLGCGNGNCTALSHSHFPNSEYTLVDASAEMLKICQQRFSITKIHFQQAFFQELNFEAKQFDLVVAGFSLHHLKAKEKQVLFPKIAQWLNNDGLFTYSDLMIDRNNNKIHTPMLKAWEQFAKSNQTEQAEWDWVMEHYNTYDFPDDAQAQLNWLKAAGFAHADITWQADEYWTNILAKL